MSALHSARPVVCFMIHQFSQSVNSRFVANHGNMLTDDEHVQPADYVLQEAVAAIGVRGTPA